MDMRCSTCGFDVADEFVGIFANGTSFSTTDNVICGLFGCPKCNTIKFVTDTEYINKRKEMYKKQMKRNIQ